MYRESGGQEKDGDSDKQGGGAKRKRGLEVNRLKPCLSFFPVATQKAVYSQAHGTAGLPMGWGGVRWGGGGAVGWERPAPGLRHSSDASRWTRAPRRRRSASCCPPPSAWPCSRQARRQRGLARWSVIIISRWICSYMQHAWPALRYAVARSTHARLHARMPTPTEYGAAEPRLALTCAAAPRRSPAGPASAG